MDCVEADKIHTAPKRRVPPHNNAVFVVEQSGSESPGMPNTCNGLPCQLSLNTVIFHTGAKPEKNLSSKNIIYSFFTGQWSNKPLLSPVPLP